ncbi:hypothetical protein FOZ60_003714 [Perkinsus olseni]|uniref:Adenylyl cyclase-associated protein n=1 Tax=Perkinsus olseni TaxID=32597 RepID=A0A7J6PJR1_PEROL|nr:hypothetical protein FOZ60_003714 [Perkinsus olseni]
MLLFSHHPDTTSLSSSPSRTRLALVACAVVCAACGAATLLVFRSKGHHKIRRLRLVVARAASLIVTEWKLLLRIVAVSLRSTSELRVLLERIDRALTEVLADRDMVGLAVASSQRSNQNSPTAAAASSVGGHNGQGRKLKPAATMALHEFKRSKHSVSFAGTKIAGGGVSAPEESRAESSAEDISEEEGCSPQARVEAAARRYNRGETLPVMQMNNDPSETLHRALESAQRSAGTSSSGSRQKSYDVHGSSPAQEADVPPLKRRLFESLRILCIDIGGTRTKFMYQHGNKRVLLPAAESATLWDKPNRLESLRKRLSSHLIGSTCDEDMDSTDGPEEDEPGMPPSPYVRQKQLPVAMHQIDRVVFSVPGTVELTTDLDKEDMCTVKNMPSLSPLFRGFNFKSAFSVLFPCAKIYAVADNLAAAMGVACMPSCRNLSAGLVVVLGTAPAAATFYRPPSHGVHHRHALSAKTIELAMWQSWIWFTKMPLNDPYGYCGGLKVSEDGKIIQLKDQNQCKIPHHQARIRFALDTLTWKRLRGKHPDLPKEMQGNLSEAEATKVWCSRVQSMVNVMAQRFHGVYGPPDTVVLLGGNALRCRGQVTEAEYFDPDCSRSIPVKVPVMIPDSDSEQQLLHMSGLAQASAYRIQQVHAPGPDPLARGWTRGEASATLTPVLLLLLYMTESSLLKRLEEVTSRLEDLYNKGAAATDRAGGCSSSHRGPATAELPDFVAAFDAKMTPSLDEVMGMAQSVGESVVLSATQCYCKCVKMLRNLLLLTTIARKPGDGDWQVVLAPLMELSKEVGKLLDSGQAADLTPLVKGTAEAMNLVMIFVTPGNPKDVVVNCLESADYYFMQVLRRKIAPESAWVKAMKASLTTLREYFSADDRFKMGIMWKVKDGVDPKEFLAKHALSATPWPSSIGSSSPPPPPPSAKGAKGKAPPPPPPPAPGSRPSAPPPTAAGPAPGGMAAVFADIRKMGSEGNKGLKHVTAEMKTKNSKGHVSDKYRRCCEHSVTAINGNGSHTQTKGGVKACPKKPRCEVLRDNWIVENYINHSGVLELPDVTMKQLVYISNSTNTTIQIPTKCKSVCLDGSKNVQLILESVISSVELVNCESCRVQTIGCVPCISIDKCSGVQLFLSNASLDCTITTSKSSEMNLNIPISEDGDYKEMPIPEQFVHKLVGVEKQPAEAKLHSTVSDLRFRSFPKSWMDPSTSSPTPPAPAEATAAVPTLQLNAKRKCALVVGFNGTKYRGLQMNVDNCDRIEYVESDLLAAMKRAGVVKPDVERLEEIQWTRSSRTDAGVSAARIVVSAKILVHEAPDVKGNRQADRVNRTYPEIVDAINKELPKEIRVFNCMKICASFNAQKSCNWRHYSYYMPMSLAGDVDKLQEALGQFTNAHNYHNFTNLSVREIRRAKERKAKKAAAKKDKEWQHGPKKSPEPTNGDKSGNDEKSGEPTVVESTASSTVEESSRPKASDEPPAKKPRTAEPSESTAQEKQEASTPVEEASTPTATTPDDDEDMSSSQPAVGGTYIPFSGSLLPRLQVLLDQCNSAIHSFTATPLEMDGGEKWVRVDVRGQFFLYNQIRLMIGGAIAYARGVFPSISCIQFAVDTTYKFHSPLAPACGLILHTSGFTGMDTRAGYAIMEHGHHDSAIGDSKPPEAAVYEFLSAEQQEEADKFLRSEILPEVRRQWLESNVEKEFEDEWLNSAAPITPDDLALMEKAVKEAQEAASGNNPCKHLEAREKKIQSVKDTIEKQEEALAKDEKRQRKGLGLKLPDATKRQKLLIALLPNRTASDILCTFPHEILPGPRLYNITLRLAWAIVFGDYGLSASSGLDDIMKAVAEQGIKKLEHEGKDINVMAGYNKKDKKQQHPDAEKNDTAAAPAAEAADPSTKQRSNEDHQTVSL